MGIESVCQGMQKSRAVWKEALTALLIADLCQLECFELIMREKVEKQELVVHCGLFEALGID